ncbi:MAG TPA: MFS transporter [Anaerolineales bacterium]|nr:MFS transporter [Anaerolineales bacterium]
MPKRSPGLSSFSLLDLPPAEQAVLKFLLRRDTVTESVLRAELGKNRFSDAELNLALEYLEKQGWLKKTLIGDKAVYSIALGQRGATGLAELNLHRRASTSSLTSVVHMLQSLEGIAEPQAVPEARGAILSVLIALAVVNSFVLGVLDVTAISGFVTQLGTRNLPWLWMAEMVVGLVISGIYLRIIDRLSRPLMMKIVLGLLVFIYTVIFGLFIVGVPTQFLYPLVYLVYSQQVIIFPIVFWNLASTFYSMAQARHSFPILASGEMIGNLIGYAVFSLPGLAGLEDVERFIAAHPSMLVGIGAGLLAASLGLVLIALRGPSDKVQKPSRERIDILRDIRDAYETIRAIPLFRYLFVTMTLVWVVLTVLWYQFYTALDQISSSPDKFSTFYSLFGIALVLVPLILQWILVSALIRRIPPRDVALGIPAVLIATLIFSIALPLPVIAVGAIFFPIVLDKAWDTPVFQTLQNLIPEDRRGRVSALLNNYTYAFGTIGGGLLVVVVLVIGNGLLWTSSSIQQITLMLAFFAALGAVTAALWVRATYDDSMFSWRLTRRQRTDLLDKIK